MYCRRIIGLPLSLTILLFACSAPPPQRPDFPHEVQFQLGESEYVGNDRIEILEVWGSKPEYQPEGRYLVRGTYRLASVPKASLLLATTTSGTDNSGMTDPAQIVKVTRGSGKFELVHTMPAMGYPHLTFYGPSGSGIGGVYFGTGGSVKRDKGWSYSPP